MHLYADHITVPPDLNRHPNKVFDKDTLQVIPSFSPNRALHTSVMDCFIKKNKDKNNVLLFMPEHTHTHTTHLPALKPQLTN